MSRHSAKEHSMYQNGFLRGPKGFKLIINKLDNDLANSDLMNEKNWHLMWIDSDDN